MTRVDVILDTCDCGRRVLPGHGRCIVCVVNAGDGRMHTPPRWAWANAACTVPLAPELPEA